jgi:hypothetical protein
MNSDQNKTKISLKANLIGTVLDIGISLLLGAAIIGQVSLPTLPSPAG